MTETQKRIRAYKKALPGLRERVVAVALMLVMSVAMMASASFAWLSLSAHPELSDVATTIAGNGNLEIALVPVDGSVPGASMIGDSSATEGQTITGANVTWGNLINLSDPAYGLDHLVLRPAMLGDTRNLLDNPLISVNYGEDGRVETTYNEDFRFTNWNAERKFFEYSTTHRYGVRAISTIEFKVQDSSYEEYRNLSALIGSANRKVMNQYNQLLYKDGVQSKGPSPSINAIAGLIGVYLTGNLNKADGDTEWDKKVDATQYVEAMYDMMLQFESIYETAAEVLVAMANVQVYMKHGINNYKSYIYTPETLMMATTAELSANGVTLDSLSKYKTDLALLTKLIYGIEDETNPYIGMKYYNDRVENNSSTTVSWADIKGIVNEMVDIPSCLVNGTKVSNIGVSAAMGLLGKDIYAVIQKGLIKDFEELTGQKMNVSGVKVSVKYITTISMEAKSITTNASTTSKFQKDEDAHCGSGGVSTLMEGSAQDTYGLAVDLWVRTNAPSSYLILEGNVLTKEEEVQATITITTTDASGNETSQILDLYKATITYKADTEADPDAEDTTIEVELYKIDDVWHFADNHQVVYDEENELVRGDEMSNPVKKMVTVTTVIGYEGENRVWDDNELLTVNSTTQGSGSCYVFYADNPTDQENSLKLLSNMRVAFIDAEGHLIAKAKLDTKNSYEASGKVTVPLVLMEDNDSSYYTMLDGKPVISYLEQNVATRLTALVYLEGTNLTNDQVLATSDIQGKLNIQFGSTTELIALGDEALENAEMHISAELNGPKEFDFDTVTGPMTTGVKVMVDGTSPSTVKAFFIRQVNEFQGSREEEMTFTETSEGVWEADHTFTVPGTYVLRSVQLDGQEYDLQTVEPITVVVKGFAMKAINCNACTAGGSADIMTGDRSVSTGVSVAFASNDPAKMPKSVEVQFVSNDGNTPVYAKLSYNSTSSSWEGKAIFTSSGSYTMKYVIMDGNYTELDADTQQCDLDITLGIQVRIRDDQVTTEYIFEGATINIGVVADIYNEGGEMLPGLSDVWLYYSKEGSVIEGMDTALTWNATSQNYTGTFELAEPGVYEFDRLTVGDDAIRNTVGETPVYTSISPDPPAYIGTLPAGEAGEWKNYLFAPKNDATVTLRLRYVESASIYAVFDNLDTPDKEEQIRVLGTKQVYDADQKIYDVTFKIPTTSDSVSYQDGIWKLTALELKGVCDENGTYYGKAEDSTPMLWEGGIIGDGLKVQIATAKINVSYESGKKTDYTGSFMQLFKNEGKINISMTDQLGRPLQVELKEGKIQYTYTAGSSVQYGGYSGGNLGDVGVNTYEITLHANADGSGYYMKAEDFAMPYAGEYKAARIDLYLDGTQYRFGGATITDGVYTNAVPTGLPVFTVKTSSPTVKITETTPAPGTKMRYYTNYKPSSTNQVVERDLSSISEDGYSATVYIYFKSGSNNDLVLPQLPTVTLTMSDVPSNVSNASMIFGSYTFQFSNLKATQEIGSASPGKLGTGCFDSGQIKTYPTMSPAGTLTSNVITLDYNGMTLNVTLENAITINQPTTPPS